MVIHSHQKSKNAPIDCVRRPGRSAYVSIIAVILTAMVGCAPVGPDYILPEMVIPTRWNSVSTDVQKRTAQPSVAWWQTFNDPVLIDLVQLAKTDSLDIKEALSRVREARMRRLKSRASFFPTLDAAASARKSGSSAESGSEEMTELYSAGFDAGWELDLFGGLRRSAEAYQADLEAQIEDLHGVVVALLAEVAVNYIDARTYQARLTVAHRNVSTQQETWELLAALARAGSGDELAVAQARYNLESSKAKITDLNVGLEAALNRLSLLTGKAAGSLPAELSEIRPIPVVSIDPAVGIPADVIRQRPDIRQAERELAAQTARIGVAKADLYPSFTLSGSIGWKALSSDKLIGSGNRTWSFGPSFNWPIFNAGAVRGNINVQIELQQQARIRYEAAVLSAIEEVENALVVYAKGRQKLKLLDAAVTAARSAAELAEHQYATGLTAFSDVLDAQRSLLTFEDQLVESRGAVLSGLVNLYKALGGGWHSDHPNDDSA